MTKKLDKIFNKSRRIVMNDNDKFVIMSDCHRGSGDNYDNFTKNRIIFEAALLHYYKMDFTYIELGDGDDMWEVRKYKNIVEEHIDTFKLLKKFNDDGRLIMVYGNHDICKRNEKILKKVFSQYYDKKSKKTEVLLNNLVVYEGIVFEYKNKDIFMLHGHQVDLLNSTFWRISRFWVRYIWRAFEKIGFKDPTNAARNYRGTKMGEKKLKKWSIKNNKILIAGHTHRPVFPKKGNSLYFNDGSCIHPNGITCLEIENGNITLVKWSFKLNKENLISIGREIIEGDDSIEKFYLDL